MNDSEHFKARKYWWVNHKQTVASEVGGGYLWSPKAEASGFRSQFYENMTRAAPGDVVVSYANGQIGHFGVITEKAKTFQKPVFESQAGSNWDKEGWRVPVKWSHVENPLRPKDHWAKLGHLFPAKYSPINSKGNGNQKAYLAEVSLTLIEVVAAICNVNLQTL